MWSSFSRTERKEFLSILATSTVVSSSMCNFCEMRSEWFVRSILNCRKRSGIMSVFCVMNGFFAASPSVFLLVVARIDEVIGSKACEPENCVILVVEQEARVE